MRVRTLVLAVATIVALSVTSSSQAAIRLNFGANPGSEIIFTGTPAGDGASFTLTPGTGNTPQFDITSVNDGTGSAVGLKGDIVGTYSYTTASITTVAGVESAPLTGSGALSIFDGANTLTGTVAGTTITTVATGGVVNLSGAVNLSGLSYGGTNADLLALVAQATANGGIATLTFQFIPALDLFQLAAKSAVNSTSYSGSLTSAPEPATMAMALIGLPLVGLFWARRRQG